jgi:hypothetical protein
MRIADKIIISEIIIDEELGDYKEVQVLDSENQILETFLVSTNVVDEETFLLETGVKLGLSKWVN